MSEAVYTISQINRYISSVFSSDRNLLSVSVRGEISNCKYHSSGHIYFTLKDDGSQLSAVMWRSQAAGLKTRLTDGMQVVARGRISAYEKGGIYQLYADDISPDGVGALYELFERLKEKLTTEGLFDASHKKEIPFYAKTLGVVTASTGAAVQDIISISRRRNPYIRIILYPAKVQGRGAAESVIEGINRLEAAGVDVMIIGRGGGSMEDLFEFNNEALVRRIYDCKVPIISAVGHETDFTLADFAADLRAATPSAAAELAVCEIDQLLANIVDMRYDLATAIRNKLEFLRNRTEQLRMALKANSPSGQIERRKKECEGFEKLMHRIMHDKLERAKQQVLADAKALDALSPLKRLEAGYAYVTDENGHNIKTVSSVKPGSVINVRLTDGTVRANVLSNGE